MSVQNTTVKKQGIKPINPVAYYRDILLSRRGDLLNYIPVDIAMTLSFDGKCAEAMAKHPRSEIKKIFDDAKNALNKLDDEKRSEFAKALRWI